MKYNIFMTIFCTWIVVNLSAQNPVYQSYEWTDIPQISASEKGEKINLKNVDIIEFIFEDDVFVEYQIKHMIELINSDEQVQLNNKKYIPFYSSAELIDAGIRVIQSNGQEIIMDQSKILTAIDENTNQYYKYFALEGLEPGCIIDYYYVVKKYPEYNGKRISIQDEFLTVDYRFELFCPDFLEFDFRVYNDDSFVIQDTSYAEKKHWVYFSDHIEGLKDEDSAPYNLLLKQLVYKLDRNLSNQSSNLTSFGALSTNVYNLIYSKMDKQDQKALKSLIKEMKISEDANQESKIIEVENYIKDNMNFVSNNDPQFNEIASIINLRSASAMGIIRLFVRTFEEMNIDVEIVLTGDRSKQIFDKDFESYHYFTDYLIYFPGTDAFIAPDIFEYRYGIIPWKFTDHYGLFIREVALGDYKTGIGEVKYIPLYNYDQSYHNTEAIVTLSADFNDADLQMRSLSMGNYALHIQPYFNLIDEQMREEFLQDHFKQFFAEGTIKECYVENGEAKYIGKKPFIVNYNAVVNDLVDRAGSNYIIKIGKLIGPQVELYSEAERKLPFNDSYKRLFDRKLVVNIPEGYRIKNPDDLIIYEDYVKNGKKVLIFDSNYILVGQVLTVDIHEYYDQINYDLNEYEAYRNVVNSAADFEKVVLVLEKNNP